MLGVHIDLPLACDDRILEPGGTLGAGGGQDIKTLVVDQRRRRRDPLVELPLELRLRARPGARLKHHLRQGDLIGHTGIVERQSHGKHPIAGNGVGEGRRGSGRKGRGRKGNMRNLEHDGSSTPGRQRRQRAETPAAES